MVQKMRAWLGGSIVRKLWSVYFLVILVTVLGITAAVYGVSINMLSGQAELYNWRLLEAVSERLNGTIMQLDNISYFIYQDDVQKLLNEPRQTRQQQVLLNRQLTSRFYSWMGFLRFNVKVNSLRLVKQETLRMEIPERYGDRDGTFAPGPWYEAARAAYGRLVFFPIDEMGLGDPPPAGGAFRFGAARWVYNLEQYEPLGALVMDIEIADIRSVLDSPYADQRTEMVAVARDSGRVIFSTSADMAALFSGDQERSKALLNQASKTVLDMGGKQWLMSTFVSEQTGWCFVTLSDYDHLSREAHKLSYLIVGISLIGALVAIGLSTITARRVTAPIKNLKLSMTRVRDRQFGERIPVTETDEIGDLQRAFNEMIGEIDHLITTVYEEDLKEKQATLNALQAQINPHFLYNTLDTINSMAVLSGNLDISRVAIALGGMFRYAVQREGRLVTLGEELGNLDNYIQILSYRFGERFAFWVDVPEALRASPVLRLTLQPLVENAILHGLEPRSGAGTVRVSAALQGGDLLIDVEDDGVGVDGEQLALIGRQLLAEAGPAPDAQPRIGLVNVNERLKLFFGPGAGVSFSSVKGKGSHSVVRIPREGCQAPQIEK